MSDYFCNLAGNREDTLIDYVYGELDLAGQRAFEMHLALCRACSEELAQLEAVRSCLRQWGPPERAFTESRSEIFPASTRSDKSPRRLSRWLLEMPAWAQAAAALLFVGAAAGV